MKLDERAWISSAGLTPEWAWVGRRRGQRALDSLKLVAKAFAARSPASVRPRRYLGGLSYFLRNRSPWRDRLLSHPSLDYWLFLWEKHFSMPCDERNWDLQFGLFQGFAAFLAAATRQSGEFDAVLDPDSHLHFYGGPAYLAFPKGLALKSVRVAVSGDGVSVRGPDGISLRLPARLVAGQAAGPARSWGPVRWPSPIWIAPEMSVESCGFLTTHGVVMHGLAQPTDGAKEEFARVIRTAMTRIRDADAALHAEMTEMVRVLVPLANPVDHGSVSSSYVNLRGAICLSHSPDPLLQAETLIHEFCHQKMNQLLLEEPILLPGQAGQVFYSPWRPDARRLRGLILGAHAFLNVAHYLVKSLERENFPLRSKISIMTNVARRVFEVEQALRTVASYGRFTEFGRRFVFGMWGELTGLFHAVQWFPPALIREARLMSERHRRSHSLPLTGLHKKKGESVRVRLVPFGQKRVVRRRSSVS